ncbi:S-layer homology domain-containing protein [Paenibacillus sp. GCM10027626]|uniref:S-layer homology domain-containing protein n=1 Tax=Paenibacillus sp. GCM10027626 TaxID=3273411 RepID=UPI003637E47F
MASMLAFLLITTVMPELTGGKAYATSGYSISTSRATTVNAADDLSGVETSEDQWTSSVAFAGGDGSLENPYLIETAEQLNAVRDDLNADYQLISDIDLSGYNWEPIGSLGNEFNGSFDGQGNVITGLSINRSSGENQGLFGIVDRDGMIRNVGLEGVRILGKYQVGGLVGVNYGAVEESYATGTVSGDNFVGVLVGLNGGPIRKSYAVGTATGNYSVGGLAGMIENLDLVRDVYFSGQVSGQAAVGGLIGAIIRPSTIKNSYWNVSAYASNPPDNGIGTPVTEENMTQRVTYENWDFTDTWYLYNGETFPFLQLKDPLEMVDVQIDSTTLNIGETAQIEVTAQHLRDSYHATLTAEYAVTGGEQFVEVNEKGQVTAIAPGEAEITVILHGLTATVDVVVGDQFAGGDGSLENPYLIETAKQLNAVRDDLNAHYQLISDIDISGYSSGEGWKPIGNDTAPFQGMFDGQNYVIKHLTINRNEQDQGLFGVVGNGGQISNVALEEVNIHVFDRGIGGLAGKNNGEINESYVKGTVTGADEVGGLVGHNAGEIHHTYSTSRVTANVNFGKAGGLVGYNDEGEIHHSYAGGEVTANNTEGVAGGLVGVNESSGRVNNSYWNISAYDTIPPDNGVGTPVTEDEMKQRGTFNDWDFTDVWYLYNGETFPFLQWEDPLEMVDVQLDSTTLNIGETAQITVTARHQQGTFNGTFSAEYAVTEGEDIVEVDLEGQVTAKAPGEAVITVSLHGEVSTKKVNVHPYTIKSVEHPNPITVANGTTVEEIGLPNTIEVTLSPGDGTREISIEWADADEKNPYHANVPGTYTFTGTLVNLPEDVENPNGLTATANVTLDNPFITGVADLDDINVANGTKHSALGLPEEVEVTLNNGNVAEVRITWDDGNPKYDGMKAGAYTFTGKLELPEGVLNPDGLSADIHVTVLEKSPIGGGFESIGGGNDLSPYTYVVGSSGRTITFSGGQLIIPKGAWNGSFSLTINVIENTSSLPLAEKEKLVSQGIGFTKNQTGSFLKEVTVILHFRMDEVREEEATVSLYGLNEETNKWVELKNIRVDWEKGTVSGNIDHLTRFAVIASKKENYEKLAEDTKHEVELTDIDGHWAKESIQQLVRMGVISGYSDGTFKPNHPITRAEFVSILVRVLNLKERSGVIYSDTKDHWAQDVIATAQAHGIITGYTNTLFGANDPITREQMAVMLMRAAELPAGKKTITFNDQGNISSWAQEAVAALSEQGIILGHPDGSFQPQKSATRSEAAATLVRTLEKVKLVQSDM